MKTPLEKQLEKAYQIFNKDHERLREKLVNSVKAPKIEPEPEREHIPERRSSGPSMGEIIMDSRIFKIAAGIIIFGIVAIALKVFTGSNSISSVAFAEVLDQIHNKSYTFDLTTSFEGQSQHTGKCMILQPGLMRYDDPELMGRFTSISNLRTDESIVIYHGQKTVIDMKEFRKAQGMPDEDGPIDMLINPIENLWNLQDGTQISLGEKEIDGVSAIGFKVKQQNNSYSSDIVVWANSKNGIPIRVEITRYNPKDPSESATQVMSNFILDVELDPELFSMKIPEGYTLAYQNSLKETIQRTDSTSEADKIQQSIEFWNNGNQDKAIETLLSVDWSQPFKFSEQMYFFYLKEKEFAQLKLDEQQKVRQELVNMSNQVRDLCLKIWEDAQTAISNQQYEKAEKYLITTLEFGRLINRDPEITLNVKMIGYAIQQKTLSEMVKLYTTTGETEKQQQAQENLDKISVERENVIQSL